MFCILLYKIEKETIIPVESATEEDVLLVETEDQSELYVYVGKYSEKSDEFISKKLYERIINKFHNSNIIFLKTKMPYEGELPKVAKVKEFLLDHMEDDKAFDRKRAIKRIFLLQGLKENIQKFKNYENSREWRSSVTNLTQIRKLSIFNFWILLITAIFLIVKVVLDVSPGSLTFINEQMGSIVDMEGFRLWIQNISFAFILCAVILLVVSFVNLLFVAFPMKFPIKPDEYAAIYDMNRDLSKGPTQENASEGK